MLTILSDGENAESMDMKICCIDVAHKKATLLLNEWDKMRIEKQGSTNQNLWMKPMQEER